MTNDNSDSGAPTTQPEEDPVVLPDTATEEDVEFDTPYRARVSNTAEYGVFVQLAGNYPNDVSGLVHKSALPLFSASVDFTTGEMLTVTLRERTEKGLSFEILDILDDPRTSNVNSASLRDDSPSPTGAASTEGKRAPPASTDKHEDGAETSSVEQDVLPETSSEAVLETITARLDAIETQLTLDTPVVRARVFDAGDGTTLLRVLNGDAVELGHGETVTVTLRTADEQETGETSNG